MDSDFESLKRVIFERAESRLKECRDLNSHDEILRVQGAARELEQLLGVMEQMENPQEPEKENNT